MIDLSTILIKLSKWFIVLAQENVSQTDNKVFKEKWREKILKSCFKEIIFLMIFDSKWSDHAFRICIDGMNQK